MKRSIELGFSSVGLGVRLPSPAGRGWGEAAIRKMENPETLTA